MAGDPAWWDPLDAAKVDAVRAALHVSHASSAASSSAAVSGRLPRCRDRQIEAIDAWLGGRLASSQGGSLYVSGPPGTGKTLTVLEVARRLEMTRGCTVIALNCMRCVEPREVVDRILAAAAAARTPPGRERPPAEAAAAAVASTTAASTTAASTTAASTTAAATTAAATAAGADPMQALRQLAFAATAGMLVVVLDELDGLVQSRAGVALVGELVALAHAPRARLILIGVANSIDVVQQQLSRPGGELHRRAIAPAHEIFPAYASAEVAALLAERLEALPGPVFDPATLTFCARKVANGAGDMRLALEACATALGIHVNAAFANAAATATTTATATAATAATATATATGAVTGTVVSIRQMAAALGRVTGGIGTSNAYVVAIRRLPVPQQLLMATISKLLGGERLNARGLQVHVPSSSPSASSPAARFIGATTAAVAEQPLRHVAAAAGGVGPFGAAPRRRRASGAEQPGGLALDGLRAAHAGLCNRVGVTPYSDGEFHAAMDTLQSLGLVTVRGKTGPKRRVTLPVAEDDVALALAGVPVLQHVTGPASLTDGPDGPL
jgi:Cdc6-like AAA superfamily ATPase